MSQKAAKAVRRQVKRELAKGKPAIINKFLADAAEWEFRSRLWVAWKLLRGRKLEITR